MRHIVLKTALCLLLLPAALSASIPNSFTPQAPALSAKSYLLIDFQTQRVLAEKNPQERVEPASLTKMMTVYVVDQLLKQGQSSEDELVTISKKAWQAPGSKMFVKVDDQVKIRDLKQGIIVQSGNDASIAIAEHFGGSEEGFVDLMNQTAQRLGMHGTHFTNASGLPDPNHYTTAQDMALLARALIQDFPETYKTYSVKTFEYQSITQNNRNQLLWSNPLVDGIKTGHTDSAGYCLAASGKKGDTRFIAVVMGTANEQVRTQETNALLNFGFQFFETKKLYSAGTTLQRQRIWQGKQKEVNVGVMQDVYVTVSKHDLNQIQAALEMNALIKAPASTGSTLGKLSIRVGENSLVEHPIVALEEVPKAGIFSRTWDTIQLTFNQWFHKNT